MGRDWGHQPSCTFSTYSFLTPLHPYTSRFNRATDLLFEVLNGYYEMDVATAMSELYCWLRYSSIRQLTWQRNYNTQPRILSAAQERLTNAIAQTHGRTSGEAQVRHECLITAGLAFTAHPTVCHPLRTDLVCSDVVFLPPLPSHPSSCSHTRPPPVPIL